MLLWIFALYILTANGIIVPSWVFYVSWILLWLQLTKAILKGMKIYGESDADGQHGCDHSEDEGGEGAGP